MDSNIVAKGSTTYFFHMKAISKRTGKEVDFGPMDDSFRFWRRAVYWNWIEKHKTVILTHNIPDLFRKVLLSKLRRLI